MLISVNRIFNCLNHILGPYLNKRSKKKSCVLSSLGLVVQTFPVPSSLELGTDLPWGGEACRASVHRHISMPASPAVENVLGTDESHSFFKVCNCRCPHSQQTCMVKGTASNISLLGPHVQERAESVHQSCARGCLHLLGWAGRGVGGLHSHRHQLCCSLSRLVG